jgi:hypothetical protein
MVPMMQLAVSADPSVFSTTDSSASPPVSRTMKRTRIFP